MIYYSCEKGRVLEVLKTEAAKLNQSLYTFLKLHGFVYAREHVNFLINLKNFALAHNKILHCNLTIFF